MFILSDSYLIPFKQFHFRKTLYKIVIDILYKPNNSIKIYRDHLMSKEATLIKLDEIFLTICDYET